MATVTLTEFLLARIAEDEAVARRCETGPPVVRALQVGIDHSDGSETGWVEVDAGRVLLEREAKRRIVELHAIDCYVGTGPDGDDDYFCSGCPAPGGPHPDDVKCPTLRALAVVYADHPDYRDEWKL